MSRDDKIHLWIMIIGLSLMIPAVIYAFKVRKERQAHCFRSCVSKQASQADTIACLKQCPPRL